MTATETIPCLRCGQTIQRKRRGPKPRHCDECKATIKRENDRERQREIDADRRFVREVANNLRDYVTPDMWAKVEDYIAAIGNSPRDPWPVVPDRMPDGTASDAGPDDGVSTRYKDLAEELEQHRMEVIMHDWFLENPRWLDGVND